MTQIERLVAVLADRSIEVTPEQAEAMAVRLAGSVDAYLATLEANEQAAKSYRPLEGEAADKFSEPVDYYLESPAESGLPDGDQP